MGRLRQQFGLKLQPPTHVMSVNLFLGKLLLYVELGVLGDETVGSELADDPPDSSVEQPLGAHTESNGSHEVIPPGKMRVSLSKGPAQGSKLSRPVAKR